MPEIKHKFTAGKMNKDLDERLVPNGEYRDAMNIQVSTSEGSDVGTVQNILGNSLVLGQDDLPNNISCVGSISDEKNDALYWLLTNAKTAGVALVNFNASSTQPEVGGSWILRKKDNIEPVFVDIAYVMYSMYNATGSIGYDLISKQITLPPGPNTIVVGMILNVYSITLGGILQGEQVVTNVSGNVITLDQSPANLASLNTGTNQWLTNTTLVFSGSQGNNSVLGLEEGNLITGINIIDNLLFWTDNNTEPKKINIDRSIAGTPDLFTHTSLIVNGENLGPIQEPHVTVIKKGPSQAPELTKLTSSKAAAPTGGVSRFPLNFLDIDGNLLPDGHSMDIAFNASAISGLEVGDILKLNPAVPPPQYDTETTAVRVLITAVTPISTTALGVAINLLVLTVEILTISQVVADAGINNEKFLAEYEETGKNLFKLKFPRFALRYKYEDSEYSPVGPFTNVAFLPGGFDYHPTKAYNIGMTNSLRTLTIENFINEGIPKDVVQVDILYKNDTAPSIYIVKSVYKNEVKDVSGRNTWDINSYEISTENIYAQLPENQLLRPWDNVPQTALAQEVVGNRVVYGNYYQNYNMLDGYGENIVPSFSTFLTAYNYDGKVGRKSIKSLRTYDFGIVYIDEFGRETPVFADPKAAQTVPKALSEKSTRFSLSLKDNHPDWADSYKVFIKETSNEYYNLALDRVYDAEDGNVWLSFPSIDRNKVDEETYLILKKSEGVDARAVKDDVRYKIVAIENEAPVFIKTFWELLGEPTILDTRGDILLGGFTNTDASMPLVGHSRFTIQKDLWNDKFDVPDGKHGLVHLITMWDDKGEDEVYVFFTENERIVSQPSGVVTIIPRKSKKYLVTNIELIPISGDPDLYEISIAKPIAGDESWITDQMKLDSVLSSDLNRASPHFYKKVIENKPEFDGRFFVKVIEDGTIRTSLKPRTELLNSYIVSTSIDAYHFKDHALYTKTHWNELLKFGGAEKRSGWIIDGASYAGSDEAHQQGLLTWTTTVPYASSYVQGASTTVMSMPDYTPDRAKYAREDGNQISDFNTYQVYYVDLTFQEKASFTTFITTHYGDGAGGNSPTYWTNLGLNGWGTGRSLGSVFQNGIHQAVYTTAPSQGNSGTPIINTSGTANSDPLYISLSYLAPRESPDWGDSITKYGTGGFEEVYDNNPDLVEVESFLNPNQRFRVTGSADIYKIKEVTMRYLFNYRGGVANDRFYDEHGNEQLDYNKQKNHFKSRWNRRVNYLIRYELEDAVDDLSTNTALDVADATTYARIEFLDDYFEEGPNPISQFPAVFETEPKEDVGLDIYYEATNALPLKLTYSNQQKFANIGTLLEFTAELNAGNHYVENWGEYPVDTNVLFLDRDLTVNELNNTMLSPKPHLKFSRPDGSFVFANVAGGYDQYSVIVPATLTSGPIGYDAWRGIKIEILPNEIGLGWHNCWSFGNGVESNRIGDTYNKPYLTNGAKASTTLLEQYAKEHRKHGLIYSNIYNSNSNTNGLNQFIAAEKITKDINPTYGSIQKLHTRDSNLVVLCEDKILKVTANKDALYNADGNPQLIATDRVLGQTVPFVGEYGISQNPESFASESYRAYFTDKSRGAVIRLSMDGITPISEAGMSDWFKDNLKLNDTIVGSYDDKKNEYNIALKHTVETTGGYECGPEDTTVVAKTISFKESIKGWVSFKSFVPENAISCNNEYYTLKFGRLYLHHDEGEDRNTFYGDFVPSKLSVVLNDMPGLVKSFNTLNYEGSKARVTQDLGDDQYFNLNASKGWFVDYTFTNKEEGSLNEFIEKEGKWFNYIKGISSTVDCTSDLAGFNVQGLGIQTAGTTAILGCTDPTALNYDPLATEDDKSCTFGDGCTDPLANNYNSEATIDDGSCTYGPISISGCTDITATNYNAAAQVDDGSCTYAPAAVELGCTDPTASNFNPLANTDDGSCIANVYGCTAAPFVADQQWWDDTSIVATGQIINNVPQYTSYALHTGTPVFPGVQGAQALNYYAGATVDNGSCLFMPPRPNFMAVELTIDTDSSVGASEQSAFAQAKIIDLYGMPVGSTTPVYQQYVGSNSTGTQTFTWTEIDTVTGATLQYANNSNHVYLQSGTTWSLQVIDAVNSYVVNFAGVGFSPGTQVFTASS